MKASEFDVQMRQAEWFHGLKVPNGMWIVLRLDGRSFTKLTKEMEHPFDIRFHHWMEATARHVFEDFDCIYGVTHSDEISLLLQPDTDMFDREVEKLVSVSASLASSQFTYASQGLASFDSRIVMFADANEVASYFLWRQMDAHRGCLNSYAYWTLRKERGLTARAATSQLHGMATDTKNAFLFDQFGINYTTDVPLWQKRGTGFYWSMYEKQGWNPQSRGEEWALRRILTIDDELPYAASYSKFLEWNLLGVGPTNKWCFEKRPDIEE